jgi:hypothetical protein
MRDKEQPVTEKWPQNTLVHFRRDHFLNRVPDCFQPGEGLNLIDNCDRVWNDGGRGVKQISHLGTQLMICLGQRIKCILDTLVDQDHQDPDSSHACENEDQREDQLG